MKTKRKRVGDKVVTVTAEDAVIDFADILEYAKSEYDDQSGPPWADCDGWEHEFKTECPEHNEIRNAAGWVRWSRCYGGPGLIVIDPKEIGLSTATYGSSKQVAAEFAARVKKEATEQLVKWYENGYEVWIVSCEYKDASDSICGVYDDDGKYVKKVMVECALEVAADLEKDGYTVTNKPDRKSEPLYGKYHHFAGIPRERLIELWHMKHGK